MNDELKTKAQQYLTELDATRRLPFKRGWSKYYKTYTPSIIEAKKFKTPDEMPIVIDVKNNIGPYFSIPLIILPLLFVGSVWQPTVPWVVLVTMLVNAGIWIVVGIYFENVPGKWIWLRMTHHGLWLTEENILVQWGQILWTGIEIIPSGDNDEENFIVNYYDERYNDFRQYRISTQKLSIKNAELCFYIEYFRNDSQHAKQT